MVDKGDYGMSFRLFERFPFLYKGDNIAILDAIGAKRTAGDVKPAEAESMPRGTYVILNIPGVDSPCMDGVRDFKVRVVPSLAEDYDARMLKSGIKIAGSVTTRKGNSMYEGVPIVGQIKGIPVVDRETLDFIVKHTITK